MANSSMTLSSRKQHPVGGGGGGGGGACVSSYGQAVSEQHALKEASASQLNSPPSPSRSKARSPCGGSVEQQ